MRPEHNQAGWRQGDTAGSKNPALLWAGNLTGACLRALSLLCDTMKPACSGDLLTVLFVDDDADDRMLFQTALGEVCSACRLLMVTNGAEAMQVLTSDQPVIPDVVFIDINMPLMNGRELLTRIRQRPEFDAMPVVVYSTSTFKHDRARMQQLGAHSYLVKPITYNQLCIDLRSTLSELGFRIPEMK